MKDRKKNKPLCTLKKMLLIQSGTWQFVCGRKDTKRLQVACLLPLSQTHI